jgi:hypothetical protein
MSISALRSNIIDAISVVEDENLLEEISLMLENYTSEGNHGIEMQNILGPVDFEELEMQLNKPEEEYTWEEVKKQLISFSN